MKPDLLQSAWNDTMLPLFRAHRQGSWEHQCFCKPGLNSQDKAGFWIWGASRSSLLIKCSFDKLVFCHLRTVERETGTDSTSRRAVPFSLNHGTSLQFLQFPTSLYFSSFPSTRNKPLWAIGFPSRILLIHKQNRLLPLRWITSLVFVFNLRRFPLCT